MALDPSYWRRVAPRNEDKKYFEGLLPTAGLPASLIGQAPNEYIQQLIDESFGEPKAFLGKGEPVQRTGIRDWREKAYVEEQYEVMLAQQEKNWRESDEYRQLVNKELLKQEQTREKILSEDIENLTQMDPKDRTNLRDIVRASLAGVTSQDQEVFDQAQSILHMFKDNRDFRNMLSIETNHHTKFEDVYQEPTSNSGFMRLVGWAFEKVDKPLQGILGFVGDITHGNFVSAASKAAHMGIDLYQALLPDGIISQPFKAMGMEAPWDYARNAIEDALKHVQVDNSEYDANKDGRLDFFEGTNTPDFVQKGLKKVGYKWANLGNLVNLAGEIALDPVTWATFGLGAFNKAAINQMLKLTRGATISKRTSENLVKLTKQLSKTPVDDLPDEMIQALDAMKPVSKMTPEQLEPFLITLNAGIRNKKTWDDVMKTMADEMGANFDEAFMQQAKSVKDTLHYLAPHLDNIDELAKLKQQLNTMPAGRAKDALRKKIARMERNIGKRSVDIDNAKRMRKTARRIEAVEERMGGGMFFGASNKLARVPATRFAYQTLRNSIDEIPEWIVRGQKIARIAGEDIHGPRGQQTTIEELQRNAHRDMFGIYALLSSEGYGGNVFGVGKPITFNQSGFTPKDFYMLLNRASEALDGKIPSAQSITPDETARLRGAHIYPESQTTPNGNPIIVPRSQKHIEADKANRIDTLDDGTITFKTDIPDEFWTYEDGTPMARATDLNQWSKSLPGNRKTYKKNDMTLLAPPRGYSISDLIKYLSQTPDTTIKLRKKVGNFRAKVAEKFTDMDMERDALVKDKAGIGKLENEIKATERMIDDAELTFNELRDEYNWLRQQEATSDLSEMQRLMRKSAKNLETFLLEKSLITRTNIPRDQFDELIRTAKSTIKEIDEQLEELEGFAGIIEWDKNSYMQNLQQIKTTAEDVIEVVGNVKKAVKKGRRIEDIDKEILELDKKIPTARSRKDAYIARRAELMEEKTALIAWDDKTGRLLRGLIEQADVKGLFPQVFQVRKNIGKLPENKKFKKRIRMTRDTRRRLTKERGVKEKAIAKMEGEINDLQRELDRLNTESITKRPMQEPFAGLRIIEKGPRKGQLTDSPVGKKIKSAWTKEEIANQRKALKAGITRKKKELQKLEARKGAIQAELKKNTEVVTWKPSGTSKEALKEMQAKKDWIDEIKKARQDILDMKAQVDEVKAINTRRNSTLKKLRAYPDKRTARIMYNEDGAIVRAGDPKAIEEMRRITEADILPKTVDDAERILRRLVHQGMLTINDNGTYSLRGTAEYTGLGWIKPPIDAPLHSVDQAQTIKRALHEAGVNIEKAKLLDEINFTGNPLILDREVAELGSPAVWSDEPASTLAQFLDDPFAYGPPLGVHEAEIMKGIKKRVATLQKETEDILKELDETIESILKTPTLEITEMPDLSLQEVVNIAMQRRTLKSQIRDLEILNNLTKKVEDLEVSQAGRKEIYELEKEYTQLEKQLELSTSERLPRIRRMNDEAIIEERNLQARWRILDERLRELEDTIGQQSDFTGQDFLLNDVEDLLDYRTLDDSIDEVVTDPLIVGAHLDEIEEINGEIADIKVKLAKVMGEVEEKVRDKDNVFEDELFVRTHERDLVELMSKAEFMALDEQAKALQKAKAVEPELHGPKTRISVRERENIMFRMQEIERTIGDKYNVPLNDKTHRGIRYAIEEQGEASWPDLQSILNAVEREDYQRLIANKRAEIEQLEQDASKIMIRPDDAQPITEDQWYWLSNGADPSVWQKKVADVDGPTVRETITVFPEHGGKIDNLAVGKEGLTGLQRQMLLSNDVQSIIARLANQELKRQHYFDLTQRIDSYGVPTKARPKPIIIDGQRLEDISPPPPTRPDESIKPPMLKDVPEDATMPELIRIAHAQYVETYTDIRAVGTEMPPATGTGPYIPIADETGKLYTLAQLTERDERTGRFLIPPRNWGSMEFGGIDMRKIINAETGELDDLTPLGKYPAGEEPLESSRWGEAVGEYQKRIHEEFTNRFQDPVFGNIIDPMKVVELQHMASTYPAIHKAIFGLRDGSPLMKRKAWKDWSPTGLKKEATITKRKIKELEELPVKTDRIKGQINSLKSKLAEIERAQDTDWWSKRAMLTPMFFFDEDGIPQFILRVKASKTKDRFVKKLEELSEKFKKETKRQLFPDQHMWGDITQETLKRKHNALTMADFETPISHSIFGMTHQLVQNLIDIATRYGRGQWHIGTDSRLYLDYIESIFGGSKDIRQIFEYTAEVEWRIAQHQKHGGTAAFELSKKRAGSGRRVGHIFTQNGKIKGIDRTMPPRGLHKELKYENPISRRRWVHLAVRDALNRRGLSGPPANFEEALKWQKETRRALGRAQDTDAYFREIAERANRKDDVFDSTLPPKPREDASGIAGQGPIKVLRDGVPYQSSQLFGRIGKQGEVIPEGPFAVPQATAAKGSDISSTAQMMVPSEGIQQAGLVGEWGEQFATQAFGAQQMQWIDTLTKLQSDGVLKTVDDVQKIIEQIQKESSGALGTEIHKMLGPEGIQLDNPSSSFILAGTPLPLMPTIERQLQLYETIPLASRDKNMITKMVGTVMNPAFNYSAPLMRQMNRLSLYRGIGAGSNRMIMDDEILTGILRQVQSQRLSSTSAQTANILNTLNQFGKRIHDDIFQHGQDIGIPKWTEEDAVTYFNEKFREVKDIGVGEMNPQGKKARGEVYKKISKEKTPAISKLIRQFVDQTDDIGISNHALINDLIYGRLDGIKVGDEIVKIDPTKYNPRVLSDDTLRQLADMIENPQGARMLDAWQNQEMVNDAVQKMFVDGRLTNVLGNLSQSDVDEIARAIPNIVGSVKNSIENSKMGIGNVMRMQHANARMESILIESSHIRTRDFIPAVQNIADVNAIMKDIFETIAKQADLDGVDMLTKFYETDVVDAWVRYTGSFSNTRVVYDILNDLEDVPVFKNLANQIRSTTRKDPNVREWFGEQPAVVKGQLTVVEPPKPPKKNPWEKKVEGGITRYVHKDTGEESLGREVQKVNNQGETYTAIEPPTTKSEGTTTPSKQVRVGTEAHYKFEWNDPRTGEPQFEVADAGVTIDEFKQHLNTLPELQGYQAVKVGDSFRMVDKQIAKELENSLLKQLERSQFQSDWGRLANTWTTAWATYATVPLVSVAFHARNHVGNWFNMVAGGFKNFAHIGEAMRLQKINSQVKRHMEDAGFTSYDDALEDLLKKKIPIDADFKVTANNQRQFGKAKDVGIATPVATAKEAVSGAMGRNIPTENVRSLTKYDLELPKGKKFSLTRNNLITDDDVYKLQLIRDNGLVQNSSFFGDLALDVGYLGNFAKTTKGVRAKQMYLNNPVTKSGRAVGSVIENNARIAMFLDSMAQGMSVKAATANTKKYLLDYSELTGAETNLKSLSRFYTWMRKNTALQIRLLTSNPASALTTQKIADGLMKTLFGWGKDFQGKIVPDWSQDSHFMFEPHDLFMARMETPLISALETIEKLAWVSSIGDLNPLLPKELRGTPLQDRVKGTFGLLASGPQSGLTYLVEEAMGAQFFSGSLLENTDSTHRMMRMLNVFFPFLNKTLRETAKWGIGDPMNLVPDHQESPTVSLKMRFLSTILGMQVYGLNDEQQMRMIGSVRHNYDKIRTDLRKEGYDVPSLQDAIDIGAYKEGDRFLQTILFAEDVNKALEEKTPAAVNAWLEAEMGVPMQTIIREEKTLEEQMDDFQAVLSMAMARINSVATTKKESWTKDELVQLAVLFPGLLRNSEYEALGIEPFRQNQFTDPANAEPNIAKAYEYLNTIGKIAGISVEDMQEYRPVITSAERKWRDGVEAGLSTPEIFLEFVDDMSRSQRAAIFGVESLEAFDDTRTLSQEDIVAMSKRAKNDATVYAIIAGMYGLKPSPKDLEHYVLYGSRLLTNPQLERLGYLPAQPIPSRDDVRTPAQIEIDDRLSLNTILGALGGAGSVPIASANPQLVPAPQSLLGQSDVGGAFL